MSERTKGVLRGLACLALAGLAVWIALGWFWPAWIAVPILGLVGIGQVAGWM